MLALRRLMHRFAPYDTPLLLEGEESTGKRFIAEIIHSLSLHRPGPFASVDCAALPEMVLAIELFGCAPGFHTNLHQGLPGWLELLEGGTLLLEHVDMVPKWVQSRLAKVLESRMLERLGGGTATSVSVRVMASTATGRDEHRPDCLLKGMLFDRLCGGIPFKVPPLRERGGDIALLSRHFLARANRECRRHVTRISSDAQNLLNDYPWPGNLRELSGAIRSAVLAADRVIVPGHLPPYLLALQSGSVGGGRLGPHA